MLRENNWFEMWFQDKQSILETMVRNMQADLACGYNYFGNCITKQREAIDACKREFDRQMDSFKGMEESKVQHWCYYDLRKRGVIE